MPPTIYQFFEADHDRLDHCLLAFQDRKREDFASAKPHFYEFMSGLLRHIIWEEEFLFPLFDSLTGLVDIGPTAVLRAEHVLIKRHLEEIRKYVQQSNPGSDQAEELLLQVLSAHNEKEERILYPAMDSLVQESSLEELYKKMCVVPENRHGVDGGRNAGWEDVYTS